MVCTFFLGDGAVELRTVELEFSMCFPESFVDTVEDVFYMIFADLLFLEAYIVNSCWNKDRLAWQSQQEQRRADVRGRKR